MAAAACSGGDEPSLGQPVEEAAVAASTTASTTSSNDRPPPDGDGPDESPAAAPQPTDSAETAPAETPPAETPPAETPPAETAPIETVPETGVAGLDSDDRFCAAWSRFGGTWQVLIVGSQFLEDPDRVARWEVAAAPVIAEAYDELIETLPPEVAGESTQVIDEYFGPLARRSQVAGDALRAAGATDAQLAVIAERWVAALGTRSNDSPAVVLEIDSELDPLVTAAVADFQQRRVPIHTDPSMFIVVETPATDAYIAATCPDQGTLSGVEVDT